MAVRRKNFQIGAGQQAGQFIEGFEDQLVGTKEGDENTVNVTFPAGYPGDQVAGKDASFDVSVKEIFDKEFRRTWMMSFAKSRGFADMRKRSAMLSRKQLVGEYDQVVRRQLKKATLRPDGRRI